MMTDWLNRVTKWRMVFAGWQLGTRTNTDPEAAAVRDQRELSIILRVEMTAMINVLFTKGIVTTREWDELVQKSAQELDRMYTSRFPGFASNDAGMTMDARVVETMRGWKP